MRQTYESQSDRERELRLKKRLEAFFNCTLDKMPFKYSTDYMRFSGGKVTGLIEVKHRHVSSQDFDTYMISLHKIKESLEYAELIGVPFGLVVNWRDKIGALKITREMITPDRIKTQKVNYRNDEGDIEPCVHFDIADFSIILKNKEEL